MHLTRRQTLQSAAALPLAGALGLSAAPAAAQAVAAPNHRDLTLGTMRVTPLLAGSRAQDNPHETFGTNVSAEDFAAAAAAAFLPADRTVNFFTPVVVNTGAEVILFDTGLDADGITAALAAAGYAPGDISHVVLTHMHGDHIGGLTGAEGVPTFPDAAYVTGRAEFDHWAAHGNEGFEAKVRPFAERMTFLEDGGAVAGGITAVAAYGHTPGHFAYMLDSGGAQILLLADTANHYVFSLAHPDWEVRFDADKAMAAETRRRLLGMAATDGFAVLGYHLPFPATGFIETRGEGFHFVPASYQFS